MTDPTLRATVLSAEFQRRFARAPAGVWAAPGRVNLIGEHTDYNEGFVLPVAIDRRTLVALAPRDDDAVRAWSAARGDAPPCAITTREAAAAGGWAAYVAGVAWAMRAAGIPVAGFDVAVWSEVPVGAGLSSSAALECALATALADLAGWHGDLMALALASQRAEREVVGAPVGVMDQAISLCGRAGTAMFLDCRSLGYELVAVPEQVALLVLDTHVEHNHASGGYATRRAECAAAAQELGVTALRDADRDALERLDPVLRRRARHVVTENERVLAAVTALRTERLDELGRLLDASHASLRDDFEVSVPQLDLAVDAATGAGAWGARMTGGGFGGSAVALVAHDRVETVACGVRDAFASSAYVVPTVHVVAPGDGARRLEVSD